MDTEKIKTAIDSFEEEDFMASKDALSGEIKTARDVFLKDKLGLKNDINPVEPDTDTDD